MFIACVQDMSEVHLCDIDTIKCYKTSHILCEPTNTTVTVAPLQGSKTMVCSVIKYMLGLQIIL